MYPQMNVSAISMVKITSSSVNCHKINKPKLLHTQKELEIHFQLLQSAFLVLCSGRTLCITAQTIVCKCVPVCLCAHESMPVLQQTVCHAQYLLFMKKMIAPGPRHCPHSPILLRYSVCVYVLDAGMLLLNTYTRGLCTTSVIRHFVTCCILRW